MSRRGNIEPVIIDCSEPVRERDIRALKEFLFGSSAISETELHRFLERHPAIMGALGFLQFTSEFPIIKRDGAGHVAHADRRFRDRVDILAAADSPVVNASGAIVRFAHLIELKGPHDRLSTSNFTRFSDSANRGMQQLHSYAESLQMVEQNRVLLARFGWSIAAPRQLLISGSRREFEGQAHALEILRGRARDQGIKHLFAEDLLDELIRSQSLPVIRAEVVLQPERPMIVVNEVLDQDKDWMTSFDRELAQLWNISDPTPEEERRLRELYHEQQRILGIGE